MTELVFAATQMACDWDKEGNLDRAEQLVQEAAAKGAQVAGLATGGGGIHCITQQQPA